MCQRKMLAINEVARIGVLGLYRSTLTCILSLVLVASPQLYAGGDEDIDDAYRSVLEGHLANALMLLKARQRLLLVESGSSDVLSVIDEVIDPAIHMNIMVISPPESYQDQCRIPELLHKHEVVMRLLIESFCTYRPKNADYFDADILNAIDSCAD